VCERAIEITPPVLSHTFCNQPRYTAADTSRSHTPDYSSNVNLHMPHDHFAFQSIIGPICPLLDRSTVFPVPKMRVPHPKTIELWKFFFGVADSVTRCKNPRHQGPNNLLKKHFNFIGRVQVAGDNHHLGKATYSVRQINPTCHLWCHFFNSPLTL